MAGPGCHQPLQVSSCTTTACFPCAITIACPDASASSPVPSPPPPHTQVTWVDMGATSQALLLQEVANTTFAKIFEYAKVRTLHNLCLYLFVVAKS